MSYTPKLRVLSIDFTGTEYAGAEVEILAPTIAEIGGFSPTISLTDDEILEYFERKITSWNFKNDDDTPMAPTVEKFKGLDYDLIRTMVIKYVAAVRGVPVDLGKGLTDGEKAMEESLPMETT